MKKKILRLGLIVFIVLSVFPIVSMGVYAEIYIPIAKSNWNGHTYYLYDASMTWEDAKVYCENMGGHLVSIASEEEQSIIENILEYGSKKQYWIGLSSTSGNMNWVTGEKLLYTNWDSGQPDSNTRRTGYKEQYVHILNTQNPAVGGSKRFKWNDMYNDNTYPREEDNFSLQYVGFICEWEENIDNGNRELIDTMLKTPSTEYNNDLAEIAAELSEKTYNDGLKNDTSVKNYLHYDLGFDWDNIRSYSYRIGESGHSEFTILSVPLPTRLFEGYEGGSFAFTVARKDYSDTSVLVIVAQGTTTGYERLADEFSETNYKVNNYPVYDVVMDFYTVIFNNVDAVVDRSKEYKILLTGHSLGGAAANLVATSFTDYAGSNEDVYCYTFGAIDSIKSDTNVDYGYENIHNVYNDNDVLSPSNLGGFLNKIGDGIFSKHGKFGVMNTFWYDFNSDEGLSDPDVREGWDANHSMNNYLLAVKRGIVLEAVNRKISVYINEKPLLFGDQPPIIVDGRTLVPLRSIFETLGATVDWNDAIKTVTAQKDSAKIKITIGDNKLYKNGTPIELDVTAQIVNGRTLVPVRAISEAFGCKVDWDESTRAVMITSYN